MKNLQNIVWSLVFRRWLVGCRVVRVVGWRTAIVEGDRVSRHRITPCFTVLGIKFD